MDLLDKIKLYFSLKNAYKEVKMTAIKSGWKTTEFWLTLLTAAGSLLAQYGGLIPGPWGIIAGAIVTAGYTIARTFVKTAAANGSTPLPKPSA